MPTIPIPPATLELLFAAPVTYSVPPYQRAYSWEPKHIDQFLQDLEEHPPTKTYYLGHFLFERQSASSLFVIDGQQRLSTVVLMAGAVCQILRARGQDAEALRLTEIFVSRNGSPRFQTVRDDEVLFADLAETGKSAVHATTRSQNRIRDAHARLFKALETYKDEELLSRMSVLERARITQFEVESKVQATQIFTLQNSRGKDLTELEQLKAYLMYQVYLHSEGHEDNTAIGRVEQQFELIYRTLERIDHLNEDQVLRHHDHAYSSQSFSESPVTNLKKDLAILTGGSGVVRFITEYCTQLAATFQHVEQIETLLSQHEEVADLVILDAYNSWPLLIKLYRDFGSGIVQNPMVRSVLKHAETTLVKFHFQHGRSRNELIPWTRKYGTNGHPLEWLLGRLQSAASDGFRPNGNFSAAFLNYLRGDYHYHKISRYVLWKYENKIRDRHDDQVSPGEYLNKLAGKNMEATIEHIEARTPQGTQHGDTFVKLWLNNLGNLLFMPRGMNSSQGNDPPEEKAVRMKGVSYATHRNAADLILAPCDEPGCEKKWCEHKIQLRKDLILEFAVDEWKLN